MSSISIIEKAKAFEYLSTIFFDWYRELNPEKEGSINTDFSKLKLIKLHFFTCAVTSDGSSDDLFNEFDNFYAMPLGHVESDIYSEMNKMGMLSFQKTSIKIKDIDENYFDDLADDFKKRLRKSVNLLKEKNPDLINYEPMRLVELSHTWNSWISVFSTARRLDKYSMKIPLQLIRQEHKTYSLN